MLCFQTATVGVLYACSSSATIAAGFCTATPPGFHELVLFFARMRLWRWGFQER